MVAQRLSASSPVNSGKKLQNMVDFCGDLKKIQQRGSGVLKFKIDLLGRAISFDFVRLQVKTFSVH